MESSVIVALVIFSLGVVFMVVFDVVLAKDSIQGNTFSQLARASVTHTYWLPFLLGALLGRWYHPIDGLETVVGSVWFSHFVFAVFGAIVVLGLQSLKKYRRVTTPSWVLVLVGLLLGALLIPITY
jgi:membrane associated rhomboid family serine protease